MLSELHSRKRISDAAAHGQSAPSVTMSRPHRAGFGLSKLLRAGVAGAGSFGRHHARIYAGIEGVSLADDVRGQASVLVPAHPAKVIGRVVGYARELICGEVIQVRIINAKARVEQDAVSPGSAGATRKKENCARHEPHVSLA